MAAEKVVIRSPWGKGPAITVADGSSIGAQTMVRAQELSWRAACDPRLPGFDRTQGLWAARIEEFHDGKAR